MPKTDTVGFYNFNLEFYSFLVSRTIISSSLILWFARQNRKGDQISMSFVAGLNILKFQWKTNITIQYDRQYYEIHSLIYTMYTIWFLCLTTYLNASDHIQSRIKKPIFYFIWKNVLQDIYVSINSNK